MRDQPRVLGPILFSAFNIGLGVSTFGAGNAHVASYAYVAKVAPLNVWAVGFIIVGALIPLGILDPRIAVVTSAVAFGFWVLWATLIHQTLGMPGVSHRSVATPVGIAMLHAVLAPYRRSPPRCRHER